MTKIFKDYLVESYKEYKYTLKLALDDVDGSTLDCLERCLEKYQLVSASSFKKTPIQESPLDFPNVHNRPVHISEIIIQYPGSRDFLETYIANSLGVSEQLVVVHSENDPRATETELYLERSSKAYKEQYTAANIGEDGYPQTEGAEELYTDKQSLDLLKELADTKDERMSRAVAAWGTDGPVFDHGTTLPEGYDDFNSDTNNPKESAGLFGRIKKSEVPTR